MNNKERKVIKDALSIFEAERDGAAKDVPEGARYITCSDTLATQMENRLRVVLEEDEELKKELWKLEKERGSIVTATPLRTD